MIRSAHTQQFDIPSSINKLVLSHSGWTEIYFRDEITSPVVFYYSERLEVQYSIQNKDLLIKSILKPFEIPEKNQVRSSDDVLLDIQHANLVIQLPRNFQNVSFKDCSGKINFPNCSQVLQAIEINLKKGIKCDPDIADEIKFYLEEIKDLKQLKVNSMSSPVKVIYKPGNVGSLELVAKKTYGIIHKFRESELLVK